jgi:hypothetical protein
MCKISSVGSTTFNFFRRMFEKQVCSFPAFAALSLALANSVQGATFLADCSQSTVMTVSLSAPTTTGSLTCPEFNGALGTLTSATFYLPAFGYYLPGSSFTIDNPTSSTLTYPEYELFGAAVSAEEGPFPGGQTQGAAFPLENDSSSLVTFMANSAVTINLPSVIQLGAIANPLGVPLNSSGFAGIIGSGNFVIPISVSSHSLIESQGLAPLTLADYSASFYFSPGAVAQPGVQLSSNMLFTYTPAAITPAPEPCTACLAICTLSSAALAAWLRSNEKA